MMSYASIDRIEDRYVVCEVELIELEESKKIDFCDKETQMMEISLYEANSCVGEVVSGDILVVAHDGEKVTQIYYKDYDEKKRRIEYLSQLQ